jgi:DNA-binding response OmpR family regulator
MMVDSQTEEAAKRAILAGADDVIIKPVAPGMLLDRVTYFALHRLPFIAISDYIGPERRRAGDSRPLRIKHLNVVNTLKTKIVRHQHSLDKVA